MDEKTKQELKKLLFAIREKNPHWPEEKARWIALQTAGMIRR